MLGGLLQFLTDNSGYWKQQREEKAAEQFSGLLGTLEQQGPEQPGQEGLLGSRAPDQQFWLKAATIPGYQDLAGQQLGYDAAGMQALQRQMQGQQWESENMTMAQRVQAQLAQRRDEFAESIGIEDLQRKWAGTNASIASAGAAAQNSMQGAMLKQLQAVGLLNKEQAAADLAAGPVFNRLTAADQVKYGQQLLRNDAAVESANAVLDWANNRAQGGIGTGKAGAFSADWKLATLPVLKDMVGAGALDEGERKWFEELAEDPSDKYLSQNQLNKMATIAQKVADYRGQGYQALGLKAPPVQGRGAVARALGAAPQGKLRDYTPTPKGLLEDPYRKR